MSRRPETRGYRYFSWLYDAGEPIEDAARRAFKEKERGCTVRLFGTNSLKKGAV
jgi:hypothetical protein